MEEQKQPSSQAQKLDSHYKGSLASEKYFTS